MQTMTTWRWEKATLFGSGVPFIHNHLFLSFSLSYFSPCCPSLNPSYFWSSSHLLNTQHTHTDSLWQAVATAANPTSGSWVWIEFDAMSHQRPDIQVEEQWVQPEATKISKRASASLSATQKPAQICDETAAESSLITLFSFFFHFSSHLVQRFQESVPGVAGQDVHDSAINDPLWLWRLWAHVKSKGQRHAESWGTAAGTSCIWT